ncbi:hypothetical protein MAR_014095 [Mya arenaria]|uniref:Uncharacterized protein n=1 Tax=Mya arenaria TaxID=6604 RepID=A0ABY7GAZ9_MYAAR|nr:hypothetical protein MAR_014095 [Mya arenaria]
MMMNLESYNSSASSINTGKYTGTPDDALRLRDTLHILKLQREKAELRGKEGAESESVTSSFRELSQADDANNRFSTRVQTVTTDPGVARDEAKNHIPGTHAFSTELAPLGQSFPDPVDYVECPSRQIAIGEQLNFTCSFDTNHAYRREFTNIDELVLVDKNVPISKARRDRFFERWTPILAVTTKPHSSTSHKIECEQSYDDANGSTQECRVVFTEAEVDDHHTLGCRFTDTKSNAIKESYLELPACGHSTNCTAIGSEWTINCTKKSDHLQTLDKADCNYYRFSRCFRGNRPIFRYNKTAVCKDYDIITKYGNPGTELCPSTFDEAVVAPYDENNQATSPSTASVSSK